MIELADPKSGETMADLGSGDGRILIAFGKKGIVAHGYELDPILVDKSQSDIKRENLIKKDNFDLLLIAHMYIYI